MVDEGAEAETVRPRGRKVGDFHVLEQDDIIELGNNMCSEVRMTYRGAAYNRIPKAWHPEADDCQWVSEGNGDL